MLMSHLGTITKEWPGDSPCYRVDFGNGVSAFMGEAIREPVATERELS